MIEYKIIKCLQYLLMCFLFLIISLEAKSQNPFCLRACWDTYHDAELYARMERTRCQLYCRFTDFWDDYGNSRTHNYYYDVCEDICEWDYQWKVGWLYDGLDYCLDGCG